MWKIVFQLNFEKGDLFIGFSINWVFTFLQIQIIVYYFSLSVATKKNQMLYLG